MSFPAYPDYKDSGVPWLGEVPGHWEVTCLKLACDIFPSNVDKKSVEGEQPIKLCNYTDVYYNDVIEPQSNFMDATASEDQIAKFTLRAGDTIITKDSETPDDIARSAYVPSDMPGVVCGYHLSMVRPNRRAHGAFIKRYFDTASSRAYFHVSANGLTRVGLGQYAVDNAPIALPPIEEQTAIAAFLDRETAKIDTLVAEQERLIALLKEKRQAVISHAVTKGLNPRAPMKDSGIEWLGEIPAHWDVMALKHACALLRDGTHLPPPRVDEGVPLLSVRNIQDDKFGFLRDDSQIARSDYEELARSFIPTSGDVLLAIVGATLGKSAVIQSGMRDFHIQRSLGIFRPKPMLRSEWLHRTFRSSGFQRLLWNNVGYSAQPGIYLGALANFRIAVPPLGEQDMVLEKLGPRETEFDRLLDDAAAAITLLQERRAALLSAAVTGKIDVRGLVDQQELEAA